MLHTFVALVEDKPGVLTRVASLFRRLNINITSHTVGHSERPEVSRMTSCVVRELALIKVAATIKTRSQVFELAEVFRARIVDLAPESLMLEITGVSSKVEGLIQVLSEGDNKILEISRTGRMVMRRGQHTSRVLDAMRVAEPEKEPVMPLTEETRGEDSGGDLDLELSSGTSGADSNPRL